ncbi:prenyltransferase/squalene oxidase repeat-containing protein [Microbispora amethystogenes]|uniref:prenyltransferase/squalene oxidase repeat-containing protein n=1 Tax=Microbispora amethystogenes TaxID=1427754 RepID=UPI003408D253
MNDLAPPPAPDIVAAAQDLVLGLMSMPWGQVSPSVYETGRLVTLAPWLTGHGERVRWLMGNQRADGSWGAPDGYGLVPTLSATEALLSVLRRGEDTGVRVEALREAAARGLRRLSRCLSGTRLSLPDMPAIELIVPSLVARINDHLAGNGMSAALVLPAGMSEAPLAAVREWVASEEEIPQKLLHALEIAGDAAHGAAAVHVTEIGTVGASPAASAAWLGDRGPSEPAHPVRWHLEAVVRRHGGPVPVGLPITVFERGWVLSWLARAGIPFEVPPEMLVDLRTAIGPAGTPAGAGLPPDADTTSVALYALTLLGQPQEPGSLWAFETPTHFCTWQGEEGASVSVNAHVLDAFGQYAAARPEAAPAYAPAIRKLSAWLCEQQRQDGSWDDRWHASRYYGTASCGLALHEFGGAEAADAVRAGVEWVLDTQRDDGGWGRWTGTVEETAYALQLLLFAGSGQRVTEAAARGYAYLLRSADVSDGPPLWHDKDLYRPLAVVRAAVLAAMQLAQSRSLVVRLAGQV